MEALVETGKARRIGVSNFSQAELEEVIAMYAPGPLLSLSFHERYNIAQGIHVTA
jgi:aryl-alcohol dehydrogenase-like predicted oxidoreductase